MITYDYLSIIKNNNREIDGFIKAHFITVKM